MQLRKTAHPFVVPGMGSRHLGRGSLPAGTLRMSCCKRWEPVDTPSHAASRFGHRPSGPGDADAAIIKVQCILYVCVLVCVRVSVCVRMFACV